jgi:hypothetical protein
MPNSGHQSREARGQTIPNTQEPHVPNPKIWKLEFGNYSGFAVSGWGFKIRFFPCVFRVLGGEIF